MKHLFNKIFAALVCLVVCTVSFAQIPPLDKRDVTEYDKIPLTQVQIINNDYGQTNTTSSIRIGYSGSGNVGLHSFTNFTARPTISQSWYLKPYTDGRFNISPTGMDNTCLTGDETASDIKSPGTNTIVGKVQYARIVPCKTGTKHQQFFIQKSYPTSSKNYAGSSTYVIRSTSDHTKCLAPYSSDTRNIYVIPLILTDCSDQDNKSVNDRWVIATHADKSKLVKQLDLLATNFALSDYKLDGQSIYNESITITASYDPLEISAIDKFARLKFDSPFTGQPMDSYMNATPTLQQLHIERFATEDYTATIEVGPGKLLSWLGSVKAVGTYKNITQENVKLWQNVPPYSTMWFLAGYISATGGMKIKIITDLGDIWYAEDIRFKQDKITALTVCTDNSEMNICQLSETMPESARFELRSSKLLMKQ